MSLKPRLIPVLLLQGEGLYKTRHFKDARYVGDPINTVRIFNDKEVDELILLDIGKHKDNKEPNYALITDIITEAFMPIAYGGGISHVDQAMRLLDSGVEKIILNTHALARPALITELAHKAGAQAVVVSMDVKAAWPLGPRVYGAGGRVRTPYSPLVWAKKAEEYGAGELMVTSVSHEGAQKGYDLDLVKAIVNAVRIPVIAHGGAGTHADLSAGLKAGAGAVAAGSLFVYQGRHNAVLISYPTADECSSILAQGGFA